MTPSWWAPRRSSPPGRKPCSPRPDAGRAQLGRRSEQLAVQVLRSHGYVIEQTNVRFPVGELDVVAREGRTLCFVEVRSATSRQWGGALESIGERKRRRLIRAARWYLSRLRTIPDEVRFDVVAIDWTPGGTPDIQLIRGAFEAE